MGANLSLLYNIILHSLNSLNFSDLNMDFIQPSVPSPTCTLLIRGNSFLVTHQRLWPRRLRNTCCKTPEENW